MAVTIQHLEIRFDVEGGEEEAAFLKLFLRYQDTYARLQRERLEAEEASERDRALGDQSDN
jgi:hypothetical protein